MKPIKLIVAICILFASCKKNGVDNNTNANDAKINFKFKFDSTQVRLNNIGQAAGIVAGNKAQSPIMNSMCVHYVELAQTPSTALGTGAILYKAAEVTTGGGNAIDFSQATIKGNNEVFLSVPFKTVHAGHYTWLRVSLAYQNATIKMNVNNQLYNATVAGFIGFNTYITNFKVKDSMVQVNANKAQGYWAAEASNGIFGVVKTGQAPPGATTVVNPLFNSSPIPAGSCVVTGQFPNGGFHVSGTETSDVNIIVSLSTNKSFEWIDMDGNDTYDPLAGDKVIDMGIRGMIPIIQ